MLLTHPDRVGLAFAPTPLHPMDRLTAAIRVTVPSAPRLWIKRDDQTGLAVGGNKARKLEYLIADAISDGAQVLVTGGAVQSNHARQTAAAAARYGLRCVLALVPGARDDLDYTYSGNRLLDDILGAEVLVDTDAPDAVTALDRATEQLRAAGEAVYRIPVGGSNALGCFGYVRCAEEIAAAEPRFAAVVHATGSGATQAGLVAGLRAEGLPVPVIGISVKETRQRQRQVVAELVAETMLLGGSVDPGPTADEITVDDRFVGDGYGVPTEAMVEAVRFVAGTEGILLDPVYTGKAMAGLLHVIRSEDRFGRDDDVLFVHTGGTPGLAAYREVFSPAGCANSPGRV
jgi:L-cysteate sulfo-lyase